MADTDEADFETFFRMHFRELARLAYILTSSRDDADDIVCETFAAAWEHWDRVQAADHPRAYVRRMAVNLATTRVSQAIRHRKAVTLLGPLVHGVRNGPEASSTIDLHRAVLTLPPRRRACVVLRYLLDLPEEEVAQTLRISLGTVKSQTSKGVIQLRVALGQSVPHHSRDRPDDRTRRR